MDHINVGLTRRWLRFWIQVAMVAALLAAASLSSAADDTARFYGTWTAEVTFNGQTLQMVWVRDRNEFKNYFVVSGSRTPAGEGRFSAANGKYTSSAPAPNDAGTYHFTDNNAVVCTNSAGLTVTWGRDNTSPSPVRKSSGSDYRSKPALNGLLEGARKNMPDVVLTYVEVQGTAGNYWLQYLLYSPSTETTVSGWLGGPKNGQFALGKSQANTLKRAFPIDSK
jgi:hypothetical protein